MDGVYSAGVSAVLVYEFSTISGFERFQPKKQNHFQGGRIMFCEKCGTTYNEESNFCANCGVSKAGAPNKRERRKYTPFIAGAVGLLGFAIIAAVIVAVVLPLTRLAPLRPAQLAFGNLNSEIETRLEVSPLHAFALLGELSQSGALTLGFDFDYRPASMWEPDVRGNFSMGIDAEQNAFALGGEVRVLGLPFDLEIHMNQDRLAARSRLISNDFYGITFATFDNDFRQFARLLGLDELTIREIVDVIEMIENALSIDADAAYNVLDKYTELLTDFILGLEFATSTTPHGNLIEFDFTETDIAALLNDFIDVLSTDDTIRDIFSSFDNFDPGMGLYTFNEMIHELRSGVRDFERDITADVTLGLYIGNGNRMMQIRLAVDVIDRQWNDEFHTEMLINFGNSVTDTWTVEIVTTDSWGTDYASGSWSFAETSRGYENTLFFSDSWDQFSLGSTWNPDNGRFTLSYSDRWSSGSIGGTFTTGSENSFSLSFDPIQMGRDSLSFGMSAKAGADIPDISFVNMDAWDMGLLELIERSIMGLLW